MDTTVKEINRIATITFYALSIINFVLGIVGLTFNLLIFTRPALRRQPCSLYFFSSSCYNYLVILLVIPIRLLANNYNIEMANYNLSYCKIQTFSIFAIRTISCWLITLATVDRYLHSSSNASLRQISSLRITKWAIGVTSITIFILYCHMIVYFEIQYTPNRFGIIVPSCNAQSGFYRTFSSFWYMVFYSLFPSFVMLIFGYLTIRNVHQRTRIIPRVARNNQGLKRTDTVLLRMLASQVMVIIICTIPFSIYRLYGSFTTHFIKDTYRLAQENLTFQIVGGLTYFVHSSSFYMHTLSGTIFRKELRRLIRYGTERQNEVHIQRNVLRIQPTSVLQKESHRKRVTNNTRED